MRSNAGMTKRQGEVDLRFAQVCPQLELWLGLTTNREVIASADWAGWQP